MTEFQPGQRVRVSADAEIMQFPEGDLGVRLDSCRYCDPLSLSLFDVQPIGTPQMYEYAVAHGISPDEGAGPEDAAGHEVFDDEGAAFDEARWRVEAAVFRRPIIANPAPWERIFDEGVPDD